MELSLIPLTKGPAQFFKCCFVESSALKKCEAINVCQLGVHRYMKCYDFMTAVVKHIGRIGGVRRSLYIMTCLLLHLRSMVAQDNGF